MNLKDVQTPVIGVMQNNWRRRLVKIYDHPDERDQVITVGEPFDGGNPIICCEFRSAWAHTLKMYPRIHVCD